MTKRLMVGKVPVGGGAPVSIQSMCNTKTDDTAATVAQIKALEAAGCEIIRVAVPDQAAAEAVEAASADGADALKKPHQRTPEAHSFRGPVLRICPSDRPGPEKISEPVTRPRATFSPLHAPYCREHHHRGSQVRK